MALHDAVKVIARSDDPSTETTKIQSPFSKRATLVVVACFLISSRAAHTVLCQPFKHLNPRIDMSVYITIVEACSFPVSIVIWVAMSYYSQGSIHVPNWRYRIPMYALMGLLDAINSYCSAYGAIGLHIVVYTVLKSSSIVFSVAFAKMFTTKQFTKWHYLAITTMFMASALTGFDGKKDHGQGQLNDYWLSAGACLVSAASLGLLGVTTYKFVRHEKQKSEMLCIAENNAFQALFMFCFVLPMLAMPEVADWPKHIDLFSHRFSAGVLVGMTIGFFIARPIMLFSSIAATSYSSAALTRALGAPRRLLVVIICFFLFGETTTWMKNVSIAVMCLSLVIYAFGGHDLQNKKKTQQALLLVGVHKSAVPLAADKRPC